MIPVLKRVQSQDALGFMLYKAREQGGSGIFKLKLPSRSGILPKPGIETQWATLSLTTLPSIKALSRSQTKGLVRDMLRLPRLAFIPQAPERTFSRRVPEDT